MLYHIPQDVLFTLQCVSSLSTDLSFGTHHSSLSLTYQPSLIYQCPTEGGIVDQYGCPIDSDGDGVKDCVSDKPDCQFNTDGVSLLIDTSCCAERDTCPETPRGATVDNKGCPNDGDNDGVYDGIDKCFTTQGELGLVAAGKIKIDEKGCSIAPVPRLSFIDLSIGPDASEPITVDHPHANPDLETLFAIDPLYREFLQARDPNITIDEMVKVRVMDYSCEIAFDEDLDTDFLLPTEIQFDNMGIYGGEFPVGMEVLMLDTNLNPEAVVGSPVWTIDSPYTTGYIRFCLRVDLHMDDEGTGGTQSYSVF